MPNSLVVLVVIVLSGVIAVAANAYYPILKAEEAKRSLASNARQLLELEAKRNLEILREYEFYLPENSPLVALETSAWEVVSKSGSLIGLDPLEIDRVLVAYSLINRINTLQSKALELSVSTASALGSAKNNRTLFLKLISINMEKLVPILEQVKVGE